MGKQVQEKPSRDDLEIELMRKIKTLEYDNLKSLVMGDLRIEHYAIAKAKAFFDWPIPEDEKEAQVSAKIENFQTFPDEFLVENLEDIITENLGFKKYLYIYFINDGARISIALLFKNEYYLGNLLDFGTNNNLYVWAGGRLDKVAMANYPNIIDSIRRFENDFITTYNINQFSKYIIFSMDRIKKNFKNFDNSSKIIVSGSDYHGNIRPNLILETNDANVISPVYKPSAAGKLYYNMGHLYP
ncbi:hypothetical protein SAMN05421866_1560 [Chryseobacterium oranimense]|jgi:hypothetical protein|uniref:Uncharacterized protein n=1 Tax=Chryseobacterium oranimense TaxID=421058 RepID=A0A1M5NT91_9FLAO|nr:hypothetical protein [Chryseobacterium oranimense]SHG92834.1 hypothetical protein SAMN05421866_1560 [Chryseobacterium oranimense]